jgi:pseudouridine synthase
MRVWRLVLTERLQKILSHAGVASRRASEQLIVDGRVTVNGCTIRELGAKATATDDIRVDGRRIKRPERFRYVLLHKPRGYVTTRSDPQGRPTVIDLLGRLTEYVYPAGRLDFDSEGLLLLTNDGDLAARLTHPRHGVPKVYRAQVLGIPDARDLARLSLGVVIGGRMSRSAEVRMISSVSRGTPTVGFRARKSSRRSNPAVPTADARRKAASTSILEITIREGRNRQVRKMCDAIGHPVERLTRVAIGPVTDSRLKPGQWRDLTSFEVKKLRAAASGPRH